MAIYQGYDKVISEDISAIENEYMKIMKIFNSISTSKAE